MSTPSTKPETLGIPELAAAIAESHDLTKAKAKAILDGLRDELDRAKVLDTDAMPDNVITMNSRARFREETSGREYELTLAWPHAAGTTAGEVSIFSPAGSALLGLSVGQHIDWQTPEGHVIQLKVLAVSQPS